MVGKSLVLMQIGNIWLRDYVSRLVMQYVTCNVILLDNREMMPAPWWNQDVVPPENYYLGQLYIIMLQVVIQVALIISVLYRGCWDNVYGRYVKEIILFVGSPSQILSVCLVIIQFSFSFPLIQHYEIKHKLQTNMSS